MDVTGSFQWHVDWVALVSLAAVLVTGGLAYARQWHSGRPLRVRVVDDSSYDTV